MCILLQVTHSQGLVDAAGQAAIDASAAETQAAVDAGNWQLATDLWSQTETVVFVQTNGVNFYNVLTKEDVYYRSTERSLKYDRDLSNMRPSIRKWFLGSIICRILFAILTLKLLVDKYNPFLLGKESIFN